MKDMVFGWCPLALSLALFLASSAPASSSRQEAAPAASLSRARSQDGPSPPRARDETWQAWWEWNKDWHLHIKRNAYDLASYDFSRAAMRKTHLRPTRHPTDGQIRDLVIPTLLLATADEDFETRAAGYIGLGKCPMGPSALKPLKKGLRDSHPSVRSAAVLGMGILGEPDSIPLLLDIMNDTEAAHEVLGGSTNPVRLRELAAVALGILQNKQAVPELLQIISGRDERLDLRIPTASIHSLGLIGDPAATPTLVHLIQDPETPSSLRVAAPIALGKIYDHSSAPVLREFILGHEADDSALWSAIIGYGRLSRDTEDEQAVALLADQMMLGHSTTRALATMALGDVGGERARERLLAAYGKVGAEQKVWVSLALGVGSWGEDVDSVVTSVRRAYEAEQDLSHKAGHALALGLLHDGDSAEALVRELIQSSDAEYRGYLCHALGLIGSGESSEPLWKVLRTSQSAPLLQRQAAIGLTLRNEPDVIAYFSDRLAVEQHAFALDESVTTLGLIGNRNAVLPLVEVCRNQELKKRQRALATLALGNLCDKDLIPRLSRFTQDNNFLEDPELLKLPWRTR